MSLEPPKKQLELELQLGDIIRISNPRNENLHNQTFIIDYIDTSKTHLINADTLNAVKLPISADGVLGDGHIAQIDILSRADTPSYARQNGLLPSKWVNIFFGGDIPAIITGEITNLEEDMIEVKTPDGDVLYINFDYKGMPEDLPIDSIEIRDKPTEKKRPVTDIGVTDVEPDIEQEVGEMPDLNNDDYKRVNAEQLQITVPTKNVKEQLREIIVRADQIVFGDEEFGPIVQFVDVSSKSQRFSIDEQVSDLLDDLLSTVPNAQRTPRVLNNLHTMIERFKQLRSAFSDFDKYGNVESMLLYGANHRPLKDWLHTFNVNLYWILPVVKNIKKVYNADTYDEENNDVISLNMSQDLQQISELLDNYQSNNLPAESNKYTALYSDLAPYFTPFQLVDEERANGILAEVDVGANINVAIDNLEDLYASVFSNNMIRNKRFLMTKYNLGETKLDMTETTAAKMHTVRVKMTNTDTMGLTSIMTLPEPTIRFSKINLPNTDMLTRATLNQTFLHYWEFLKKKTNVQSIFVDTINSELAFDEHEFVNGVKQYIANIPEEEMRGMTRYDLYKHYVSAIVPKTKVLFNLMKKYIHGKLSIVDVVGYLEPFLIYTDDLTFSQYKDIVYFIDTQISDYNKELIEYSRLFKSIAHIKQLPIVPARAFPLMEAIEKTLRTDVLETGYGFHEPDKTFSNSELLRKVTVKDCSKLYTSALAFQNLKLMFSKDVGDLLTAEQKQNDRAIKDDEQKDTCATVVIAKMYTSLEQLQADNGKPAYFDGKYDKTNYGLMEEDGKKGGYKDQVISLTPEKLKEHIVQDQQKRNKLTEPDATYLADTLIDGVKQVVDGQYALLYKGYSDHIADETDYYVRKNGQWVLDREMAQKAGTTDEPSIICDLQEKCISTADAKCESMTVNELGLQNQLLQTILGEFDTKYKVSKEQFEQDVREKFDYFMAMMPVVSKMETNALLKYNHQQYHMGLQTEDDDTAHIVSPFAELLDVILGQRDFVKKQRDIVLFANKFTRAGMPGVSMTGRPETEHWLYCVKSHVPLLPSFKKVLASAFLESQYVYQWALNNIKSTHGQLSDDGDWWTDKYTGWPICPGDFDTEEGFDDGFKVVSRAVMEDDAGNKILASTTEKTVKYITPETIMINNIINALSVAMGLSVETQKEFIINAVLETIQNTLESESDYKEQIKMAAQKGKNVPSYRDFFNNSLLFYTLGMYLIAVQTMVPPVKTRKTHPGCVRSFMGYPFEGQGDLSALTYLSCVTYDIRGSSEPWNVLKKTNAEKIQAKIKMAIDDQLISIPEVQRKFTEKTQYLLTNPTTDIPDEHDIAQWSDFLPPLVPFKITHLTNVSPEFKRTLNHELRNGIQHQREKIMVIESKIIQFSLAIQEKVHSIVKQHKVLLHTSNNEPYLENACCDSTSNETAIHYFSSRNPDIMAFNDIVQRLSNMLDDIRSYTEANLFYSNVNTKNKYPPISSTFNEKSIYLAFVFYCKFRSLMPIPADLVPLCTNKPDATLLDPSDTLDRLIQKLKDDGRHYTNEHFLRLLQLISRENILNIELDTPVVSRIAKLSGLLEAIYDENDEDEIVEQSLRDLLQNAVDTFDIATETNPKAVKDLNNFLIRANEDMTNELVDFVQKNSGSNVTRSAIKKFTDTITNLSTWAMDASTRNEQTKISNDAMYNVVGFYKTHINNLVNVFPTIIINKVNYDNTSIPNYYKFSKNHSLKLKKYIADYFEKLKPFYGVPTLFNILNTITRVGNNLVKLAETTPCFTSINRNNELLRGVIDERTSRFLFEYYLLRAMITYVSLADEQSMIVTEVRTETSVTDLFSVDYLDEAETRVDLGASSRNQLDARVLTGNKKELKQRTSELLIAFMDIFRNEKGAIDTTYEEIQDRVFKLREKEKDMVTDRLKAMTDEERDADTLMKITKQGLYSKGLQKGLTVLDKDFYDQEQTLRDEMDKAEHNIRRKNRDATDENIDILVDEYMEEQRMVTDIDADAYDIGYLGEDYYDGNYTGTDAPEYDTYGQEE